MARACAERQARQRRRNRWIWPIVGVAGVMAFVVPAIAGAISGDHTDQTGIRDHSDIGATIAANTWNAMSARKQRDICETIDLFGSHRFVDMTMAQFSELVPYRADFIVELDQNC